MIGDILTTLFGESFAWQDIVIAVVSILFGFILIPQLKDVWKGKTSLNLFTASLTTIGLYILAVTFFTMQFWISFIAEIFSGTIWLLLFVLSFKNKRKTK
jgi:hypothetical protein